MTHIGFLYNCRTGTNPRTRLTNSLLNRAVLIDEFLRRSGNRLFVYSPRSISDATSEVPGFIIEGQQFVATTSSVPRVNGNWTSRSRLLIDKGMGYRRFSQWARDNRIGIYVPYEFSSLASDKYKTYEAVRRFSDSLHPHTEKYTRSTTQIEQFLERSDTVFLKPRWGNKGNRILVLRPDGRRFSLTHYRKGKKDLISVPSLDAAVVAIEEAAKDRGYVVQQGIDTLCYHRSAFDVRVIVLHDGQDWHSIHEARIGARDSDVSNIQQGGSFLEPEDVFSEMFGPLAANRLIGEIQGVTKALAAHLDSLFPGELMEMAFDFMLDRSRNIHLAEINTKPGMAGIGYFNTVFNMRAEEASAFEKYVTHHTKCLARFLQRKLEHLERQAA